MLDGKLIKALNRASQSEEMKPYIAGVLVGKALQLVHTFDSDMFKANPFDRITWTDTYGSLAAINVKVLCDRYNVDWDIVSDFTKDRINVLINCCTHNATIMSKLIAGKEFTGSANAFKGTVKPIDFPDSETMIVECTLEGRTWKENWNITDTVNAFEVNEYVWLLK